MKKTSKSQTTHLSIKVAEFHARIGAAINPEVRGKLSKPADPNIYNFNSTLEISGQCNYPEDRAGSFYEITVYGHEPNRGEFSKKLSDYLVRDEKGLLKTQKIRGENRPVYQPPKSVGYIERKRGKEAWVGWLWVSPSLLSDMLVVLANVEKLYISLQELRIERRRWIVGLTIQTTDPSEE